jgi:hypothetical protein
VVEFQTDAVSGFLAAQTAADCCPDLAFTAIVRGGEADYYFLTGIVPVVADGADAAAGKVEHVDFIYYVPFMRV